MAALFMLLFCLIFAGFGLAVLAAIAGAPVVLFCRLRVFRHAWHAAVLQTLVMVALPLLLIGLEQGQTRRCLAAGYICDDLSGVFVDLASIALVIASLIFGPMIGIRIFRRFAAAFGPQ